MSRSVHVWRIWNHSVATPTRCYTSRRTNILLFPLCVLQPPIAHRSSSSPLTRQSPVLHLCQSPAPAHIRHHAHDRRDGKRLEQIPAHVIHEKHPLHRQHAAQKQPVRHRARAEGFAKVVHVGSEQRPCAQQRRQRDQDREREDEADDLGRRARVVFEDVVDLGFARVALGWGWDGGRGALVGCDGEVEGVLVERGGGAERGERDGGFERLVGREELEGEVLLGLVQCPLSARACFSRSVLGWYLTRSTLPLPFSFRLKGKDSSNPVVGSWRVRNA